MNLRKTILITFSIIGCLITTSFSLEKYSPTFRESLNIHNWRIYLNDSLIYSTIRSDFPDRDQNKIWHNSFDLTLKISEVTPQDSLKIVYYNDVICGNEPMIIISDSKNNILEKLESTNVIQIQSIIDNYQEVNEFQILYTETCPDEKGRLKWNTGYSNKMVQLKIIR
ncbi:MAG: hypothetical protein H6599_02520 [Flavobacteriales bacterium]|nr:hypothetical protein [Flavobacteriales bacterium]